MLNRLSLIPILALTLVAPLGARADEPLSSERAGEVAIQCFKDTSYKLDDGKSAPDAIATKAMAACDGDLNRLIDALVREHPTEPDIGARHRSRLLRLVTSHVESTRRYRKTY